LSLSEQLSEGCDPLFLDNGDCIGRDSSAVSQPLVQ